MSNENEASGCYELEFGRSKDCGDIFASLANAQSSIKPVTCNSRNEQVGSTFADLSALIEAARPALNGNGICFYSRYQTDVTPEGTFVVVTTTLGHSSGQWIECSCRLELTDPLPWTIASLQSYGRRYTFAAITGLSQADDDGVAAQNSARKNAEEPQAKGDVSARSKAYVDKAKEMFDAVEEAAAAKIPFSPDGYGDWVKELTAEANKGSSQLSALFSSSDGVFTSFLLNHDSDTITGLKEVAAEADRSK